MPNLKLIPLCAVLIAISTLVPNTFAKGRKNTEEMVEKNVQYPYDCVPSDYRFSYFTLILEPSFKFTRQATYFIHNTSDKPISLLQARTGDDPYIMHLKTTINPHQWSVLAIGEKKVLMICTNSDKKLMHDKVVDCQKNLDICQYTHARYGDNEHGNYWPIENNTMNGAVHAMRWHGVLLIDPKQVRLDKEGKTE